MGFSLVVVSGRFSLVVVGRLLTAVASLVAEHKLWGAQLQEPWHVGSVVAAHGV